MSDTWVDPTTDPFFQGLPTQQDIFANMYGQGFGNGDYDSPQDEVDARLDQLKEYLKMTGTYLPDRIPGMPEVVERPEYDNPVFRSDFVDTYRNDEAYNRVNQLVQSGAMGVDEAIAAVLQEAENNGWAMPLELDQGDRLMNYDQNGNPVVQYTQDEFNQAAAAGINLGTAEGRQQFAASIPAGRNINEAAFDENARKFVAEISKEQRDQASRDAAMAEYEDYIAPRYAFDYEGMMERGVRGAKTDYAPDMPGVGPQHPGVSAARPDGGASSRASTRHPSDGTERSASARSGSDPHNGGAGMFNPLDIIDGASGWFGKIGDRLSQSSQGGGGFNPIEFVFGSGSDQPVDGLAAAALNSVNSGASRANQANASRFQAIADQHKRSGSRSSSGANFARDAAAAKRTNDTNRANNAEINDAYRRRMAELGRRAQLPSKQQQGQAMMDAYLASVVYGGSQ